MLRYAFAAIVAAMLVAGAIVFLYPAATGPRPEPRILASGDTVTPPGGFVIHDAPPATATPAPLPDQPAASTAPPADLNAVMDRLRAAGQKPDATATPPDAPAIAATPAPVAAPAPDPVAPPRWSSVTGQGARWRMARSADGYTVSIDLGGGQTADVHVQPAFANLDPQAINVRVDYLRETILRSFSNQSNSYTFARDGSVSLDH
jgi:hypothetical protein